MSKELREAMVKQAKAHAERAKVGVRKARQKAISDLRREDASEDTTRKLEKHVSRRCVYVCMYIFILFGTAQASILLYIDAHQVHYL